MSLSPVFVELRASTGEFLLKMREAEEHIEHLSKKGASSFDKLAAAGKAALLGIGAAAVGIGAVSLEMADKLEQSRARMEAALKTVGSSYEALKPQIDAAEKRMEKFGFTNADVEEALGTMSTAMGSSTKALDKLQMAADLAKYKHISLSEAGLVVAKAMEGQLRPLRALGIDLPVAAAGALKMQQAQTKLAAAQAAYKKDLETYTNATGPAAIRAHKALEGAVTKLKAAHDKLNATASESGTVMDALSKKLHGQAATAAETFAGKMAAVKAQAENLSAKIGLALIPYIEKLIAQTERVVGWFEKHRTTAKALAGVIGGALTVAIAAYIAKQIIAIAQTTILIARTIALNAKVAVAIALNWKNTAALDAETAATTRMGTSAELAAGKMKLLFGAMGLLGAVPDMGSAADGFAQHAKGLTSKQQGEFAAMMKGAKVSSLGMSSADAKALSDYLAAQTGDKNNKGYIAWQQALGTIAGQKQSSLTAQQKAQLQKDLASDDPKVAARAYAKLHPKKSAPKKAPSAGPDPYAIPDTAAYDAALGDTAAKRKAARDKAAAAAKAARERAKQIREQTAARAKAAQAAAVAAAKAAQQVIIDRLKTEIAARTEVIRLMTVQMRLASQQARDLSLVNGSVVNRGATFQSLAAGGTTVQLHVHGNVIGIPNLTRVVADGLATNTRLNYRTGIA